MSDQELEKLQPFTQLAPLLLLGGEQTGKEEVRKVTTKQTKQALFEVEFRRGSSLCVNVSPHLHHTYMLYELELCWGTRTTEVMDWEASCLYLSREKQGAVRLTMQRSSPSLTSLSSHFSFDPPPCLRRLCEKMFFIKLSVQHLEILCLKDLWVIKTRTHRCTDRMKILSRLNYCP